MDKDLPKLQYYIKDKQHQNVQDISHSLKSSTGQLGFITFMNLLSSIESNSKENVVDNNDQYELINKCIDFYGKFKKSDYYKKYYD